MKNLFHTITPFENFDIGYAVTCQYASLLYIGKSNKYCALISPNSGNNNEKKITYECILSAMENIGVMKIRITMLKNTLLFPLFDAIPSLRRNELLLTNWLAT